ncbi:MAG: SOS response-associated peptidase family protein [Eggerthellaceae bacterium]|nr:SOS response-associated peptidase family protein [Eggerthellaceae bacterium]
MCGRFTVLTREELADVVESVRQRRAPALLAGGCGGESLHPRAQARPGYEVDTVASLDGDVVTQQLVWGFSVPWDSKPVINTRLESALGGAKMWKAPLHDGRCILPAASFFEPRNVEVPDGTEAKRATRQSYEFLQPDGMPLLIAGVQEAGRVSIVTTQPNAAVAPIHQRMPLVLAFEEAPIWLEGEVADLASLADRSAIPLTGVLERPHRAGLEQLSLF